MLSLDSNKIHSIYATESWLAENHGQLHAISSICHAVDEKGLKTISNLSTPNQVLAVLHLPEGPRLEAASGKSLVLDRIQDPGNLGTILRIADWFGLDRVICSSDCADHFQPKVIQASMGAFLRIPVYVSPLDELFDQFESIPTYGLVLGGENIFSTKLGTDSFIVIGNESSGIQGGLINKLHHRIEIPANRQGTESLNAAIAAGIACAVLMQSS
ncbi:MAG: TrmH family RNA methyltransferase [Bacteroidota bacterium]